MQSFKYEMKEMSTNRNLFCKIPLNKTVTYLIWFCHGETQKTFNITSDMSFIFNGEFHWIFGFFDCNVECGTSNIKSGTVMTEFLAGIDLDINVIDGDEVASAIVLIDLGNTVTFNELLILPNRFWSFFSFFNSCVDFWLFLARRV